MSATRITGPTIVTALVAACGTSPKAAPPAATAAADTSQILEIGAITGSVKNSDSTRPPCPVIPHFEATLKIANMSGKITYRWERSTGDSGKVIEVTIPDAAQHGAVTLPLAADEWLDKDRGVQHNYANKVHILSPVDRVGAPLTLQAICY